jgi:hypothetical protein
MAKGSLASNARDKLLQWYLAMQSEYGTDLLAMQVVNAGYKKLQRLFA